MQIKLTYFLLLFYIFSCNPKKGDNKTNLYNDNFNFKYDIKQPVKKWKLNKDLVEISGLSYINDSLLACNQDEKGIVYIFNTNKGKIVHKTIFETYGDFEGIEIVNKDAWIIKSNGTLYQIQNYNKSKTKNKHYKTKLSKHNNVEGLAFDKENNNLLIACKGNPFINNNKSDNTRLKGIYSFNLNSKQLSKTPKLLISLNEIGKFQPSAIAIHPIENNIYILSSVGKQLLILSKEGKIKNLIKLNKKIYQQPEGICFAPNGTMYISNEGKHGKATILQFIYQ